MKTLLFITLVLFSNISFSKDIFCKDTHGIKEFKLSLVEDGQESLKVNGDIYTKIFVKNLNKYSEVDDFATITDLKSKRTMTYSLICQDV